MSEDMTQDAVDCASEAMNQFTVQKDMAQFIKKEVWSRAILRYKGKVLSLAA